MHSASAFSLFSFSSVASLSALLCGLTCCQDTSGQCSNRTDTLCLELTVAPATPVPDSVTLTLASGAQSEPYSLTNIGTLLAMRPYVVEVAFSGSAPAMLELSAAGSATDTMTKQQVQVTAGPISVVPATAARPTIVVLSANNSSGKDLGLPVSDMSSGTPVDAGLPSDMTGVSSPWTPVFQISGTPLNGVFGATAGGTTIYAVGNGGVVIKGDGSSFTKQTATTGTGNLSGVWAADAMNVFTCDGAGFAYSTQNGAASWTASSGAAGFILNSIYGRSTSDVIAVGVSVNQFFRFNGSAWAVSTQTVGGSLTGVFASANNYYFLGSAGVGARSANGMTFTALTNGYTDSPQWAIGGLGTTDNFTVAVSGSGDVQSLNSAAVTMWTKLNSPVTSALNAVWVPAANMAIVGGTNGVVYQYANGVWTSIGNNNLSGYTITGLWGDGSTGLWASAYKGSMGAIFKR